MQELARRWHKHHASVAISTVAQMFGQMGYNNKFLAMMVCFVFFAVRPLCLSARDGSRHSIRAYSKRLIPAAIPRWTHADDLTSD